MEIVKKDHDGIKIINLSGRLDATSSIDAEQEFNSMTADEGVKLLVNLQNLEYISSAGLRIILICAKQVRKQSGKLCLCSLSTNVNDVFEMSGFSSIFDIKDSEDDAIAFLNS